LQPRLAHCAEPSKHSARRRLVIGCCSRRVEACGTLRGSRDRLEAPRGAGAAQDAEARSA